MGDQDTFVKGRKYDEYFGKTRKEKSWTNLDNSATLVASRKNSSGEYPITSVDEYFENNVGFLVNSRFQGHLNTSDRWENVVGELENLCISKKKSFMPLEGVFEVKYEVPVVGYKIFKNQNKKRSQEEYNCMIQNTWFCWNGTYYDPDFVYECVSSSKGFKKFCPKLCPLPTFKQDNIVQLDFRLVGRENRYYNRNIKINHTDNQMISGAGWVGAGDKKYFEIDLQHEQFVTHIGTAGQFPHFRIMTPTGVEEHFKISPEDSSSFSDSNKNSRHRPNFNNRTISVLDNTCPMTGFVTSFRVSYFNSASKKWVKLSDLFVGNVDLTSEVIQDLYSNFNSENGIQTQYIRIEPLKWRGKCSMRLSVYGVRRKTNNKKSHTNSSQILSEAEPEVETVTYTLQPSKAESIASKSSVPSTITSCPCCTSRGFNPNSRKLRLQSCMLSRLEKLDEIDEVEDEGVDLNRENSTVLKSSSTFDLFDALRISSNQKLKSKKHSRTMKMLSRSSSSSVCDSSKGLDESWTIPSRQSSGILVSDADNDNVSDSLSDWEVLSEK